MRRPRCLSCQERLWVDNAIGQLCIQHGVSDRDEDYRSTGWTAFLAAYRNFRPISSPAFWPYAYGQISAALVAEKRIRQDRVYKLLSLDAPFINRLLGSLDFRVSGMAAVHMGMGILIAACLVYAAVFYVITTYFLKNSLNLE